MTMIICFFLIFFFVDEVKGIPNFEGVEQIVVDSQSEKTALRLPWDATSLTDEPSLDKSKFKDYVQSQNEPQAHLEVEKVNAFSTGFGLSLNKGHIEFANGYSVGVTVYNTPNITLLTVYKSNKVVTHGWIETDGMWTNVTNSMYGPRADQIIRNGDENSFKFTLLATQSVKQFSIDTTDESRVKLNYLKAENAELGLPRDSDIPHPDFVNTNNYKGKSLTYNRPWQTGNTTILAPQFTVWGTISQSKPRVYKYVDGNRVGAADLVIPTPRDLNIPVDGANAYLLLIENVMELGSGHVGYITVPIDNERKRFLTYWDKNGNPTTYYHTDADGVQTRQIPEGTYLTDLNTDFSKGVYAKVVFSDRTEIVKVTTAGQIEIVKTFPRGTDLAIRKIGKKTGYAISGVISEFSHEYEIYKPENHIEGTSYLFTAEMDDAFNLTKWTLMPLNSADISITNLIYDDDGDAESDLENYLLIGRLNKQSDSFVDEYYEYGAVSGQHSGGTNNADNFVLKFTEEWDYAPLISKLKPLKLDISKVIDNSDLDRKLSADVLVHDTFDLKK